MPLPPNIILFNPDEWRGDVLGHLGNPAAYTPNLDELVANDAVSFRYAFCQNPVCTPSRCSFMTGWYPHTGGHRTMYYMLHPEHGEPNLLQILMKNGYYVWWGGKNDLFPGDHGHYAYCDKYPYNVKQYAKNLKKVISEIMQFPKNWRGDPQGDNYYSFLVGQLQTKESADFFTPDTACVDGACEFIKKWKKKDQSFCIYLPLLFPHPPYAVEEKWSSLIKRELLPDRIKPPSDPDNFPLILQGIRDRQLIQGWSEEHWLDLRVTYYGMCAKIDAFFGQVVKALKESGHFENTLILFFSDHGDFAGDYGLVEKNQNTFQECLSRVPFIIKPPTGTKFKPRITDALVELVDLCATIYDYAEISPEYLHFGKSLRPLIQGDCNSHREVVFCEGGRLMGEKQAMELESKSSLTPKGLYYPRISLQTTDELPYHGKAVMCRTQTHKLVKRLYEKDELYDLTKDPSELENVIDDPAYEPVIQQLEKKLLEWYIETSIGFL